MASTQQPPLPKVELRSSLFELLEGSLEDKKLDTVDVSVFGTIQRPSHATPSKQNRERKVGPETYPSRSPLYRSSPPNTMAKTVTVGLGIMQARSPPPSPTEGFDDQSEVPSYFHMSTQRPTLSSKRSSGSTLQESPCDQTSTTSQVFTRAPSPPPEMPPPPPPPTRSRSSSRIRTSELPAQSQTVTPRTRRVTRLILRVPKPPYPWEPRVRSKLRCTMSVDDYDDEGNLVEKFPMLAGYRARKRAEAAHSVHNSSNIERSSMISLNMNGVGSIKAGSVARVPLDSVAEVFDRSPID
jgi:hypothetical protein